ncbi:hypothetical protein D7231_30660 [Streptomyces klenkii]|uniref:Uncharacterized protein n=1 Tax=Streptomyces klenkii TaxID=1420899 RepID=A0A3B0AR86_9ACTN|nr:hypothetical protein D7231_30660 [Streptomyces klenkii]
MAYRNGAFVVDTRDGRIVQVIGGTGGRVRVRPPGGGTETEVPFVALRLATSAERAAARRNPETYRRPRMAECQECPALEAAWWEAESGGDKAKAAEALVTARRHWRSHMAEAEGAPA